MRAGHGAFTAPGRLIALPALLTFVVASFGLEDDTWEERGGMATTQKAESLLFHQLQERDGDGSGLSPVTLIEADDEEDGDVEGPEESMRSLIQKEAYVSRLLQEGDAQALHATGAAQSGGGSDDSKFGFLGNSPTFERTQAECIHSEIKAKKREPPYNEEQAEKAWRMHGRSDTYWIRRENQARVLPPRWKYMNIPFTPWEIKRDRQEEREKDFKTTLREDKLSLELFNKDKARVADASKQCHQYATNQERMGLNDPASTLVHGDGNGIQDWNGHRPGYYPEVSVGDGETLPMSEYQKQKAGWMTWSGNGRAEKRARGLQKTRWPMLSYYNQHDADLAVAGMEGSGQIYHHADPSYIQEDEDEDEDEDEEEEDEDEEEEKTFKDGFMAKETAQTEESYALCNSQEKDAKTKGKPYDKKQYERAHRVDGEPEAYWKAREAEAAPLPKTWQPEATWTPKYKKRVQDEREAKASLAYDKKALALFKSDVHRAAISERPCLAPAANAAIRDGVIATGKGMVRGARAIGSAIYKASADSSARSTERREKAPEKVEKKAVKQKAADALSAEKREKAHEKAEKKAAVWAVKQKAAGALSAEKHEKADENAEKKAVKQKATDKPKQGLRRHDAFTLKLVEAEVDDGDDEDGW